MPACHGMSADLKLLGSTIAWSYRPSDLPNARRSPSFASPCPNGSAMACETSGMRRKTASAHEGARTSISPEGSRSRRRTSSGCVRTASPTQEGATTRTRRLVAARRGPARELVERAAVGAARFPRLLDRQEYARVRVPELLRRQRAVQRQVRPGDFDEALVKLGGQ